MSSSPGEPLGKRNIGAALGRRGRLERGLGLGWEGVKLSKRTEISSVQVRKFKAGTWKLRARTCIPEEQGSFADGSEGSRIIMRTSREHRVYNSVSTEVKGLTWGPTGPGGPLSP